MKISIVIPAYNAAKHIKETIQQLLSDLPSNVDEIIVINDNSTDNTSEVVKELIPIAPKLKVIDNRVNTGQISSTLRGIFKATNKHVIALDDDLKYPLEAIKSLIDRAEEEDQFDIVFGTTTSSSSSSWYKNFTRSSFAIFQFLILPRFWWAKQFSSVYLVNLERINDFHPLYVWDLKPKFTFFTSINRDSFREKGQSNYKIISYLRHFLPVVVFVLERLVLFALIFTTSIHLMGDTGNLLRIFLISLMVFLLILNAWLYFHKRSVLKSARDNV